LEKKFPYPLEVNGDSYARKLKQQRKTSVSVPSRDEWSSYTKTNTAYLN